MGALSLVPEVQVRQCMNCGRPQDHWWHDRPQGWGVMSNGCAYVLARPRTLWDSVLRDAVKDAAEAVGADPNQAYDELAREWGGWAGRA